ncbi:MAG: B12-binding domain-containing radical SAM protein [Bacteroidales bacterium]|nr:B12-binding domain-containing radical SAM protein [Bacteroidales bacterium]
MKMRPVVLVAINEYDNLGVGYLSTVLSAAGFETRIISLDRNNADILKILRKLDPQLVGFSVIFQYHIDLFKNLIGYLRKKGVNSHFTAGGHYASLKYQELFEYIPFLDSIVRFEGEYTLLELVNCLQTGTDWRKIESISYKDNGKIITNRLRPLEKDLDKFPFPCRAPLKKFVFEKKIATIIAGRGCIHNCSFCNTRKFYNQSPGPVKRLRKPEMVVKEMEYLVTKKKCSIFFFLDDDFPLRSDQEPDWIIRFCNELKGNNLTGKIMWKICCRPDEVNKELFELMKSHGLFQVFLGIEDGTDIGLKRLNKHMTVAKSLEGINTLRKLEIEFDYGFLLFQPWTTYKSLNENLNFLGKICNDGYTPVTFLKLMPYYETKVEEELLKEGRLKITPGIRDYDFQEDSMNQYYDFIINCFKEWLRHPEGVANISKWGRNYYSIYNHYFGKDTDAMKLKRNFTKILSESNSYILDTLRELSVIFKSGEYKRDLHDSLNDLKEKTWLRHQSFKSRIQNNLGKLLDLPLMHFISKIYPESIKNLDSHFIIRS